MLQRIGSWAFIVGVILAVVVPIFTALNPWLTSLLIILGLMIGFLNITTTETQPFLIAALALVIVSGFGSGSEVITQVAGIGPVLGRVFNRCATEYLHGSPQGVAGPKGLPLH
jgi:uncharacterized membrane protein YczE